MRHAHFRFVYNHFEKNCHEQLKMAEFNEEACSQSSQLGEEGLQKVEEESTPKNTKKQTLWVMNKFEKWGQRRRLICDLAVVDATELNGILRRFYAK